MRDVTNTFKCIRLYAKQSNYWQDFFSEMAEKRNKVKISNVFWSFIVCSNQNRSAQVRELLKNNSLLVSCMKINHSGCMLAV